MTLRRTILAALGAITALWAVTPATAQDDAPLVLLCTSTPKGMTLSLTFSLDKTEVTVANHANGRVTTHRVRPTPRQYVFGDRRYGETTLDRQSLRYEHYVQALNMRYGGSCVIDETPVETAI